MSRTTASQRAKLGATLNDCKGHQQKTHKEQGYVQQERTKAARVPLRPFCTYGLNSSLITGLMIEQTSYSDKSGACACEAGDATTLSILCLKHALLTQLHGSKTANRKERQWMPRPKLAPYDNTDDGRQEGRNGPLAFGRANDFRCRAEKQQQGVCSNRGSGLFDRRVLLYGCMRSLNESSLYQL